MIWDTAFPQENWRSEQMTFLERIAHALSNCFSLRNAFSLFGKVIWAAAFPSDHCQLFSWQCDDLNNCLSWRELLRIWATAFLARTCRMGMWWSERLPFLTPMTYLSSGHAMVKATLPFLKTFDDLSPFGQLLAVLMEMWWSEELLMLKTIAYDLSLSSQKIP